MTDPRHPNEILPRPDDPGLETNSTAERNEIRRQESTWGMIPGIIGIVLVIMLGILLFSGDHTTQPGRTTSTDIQTPSTTPKTTPAQPQ
jgi:hypothetical protein